jgi:hypothetical protein
MGAIFTFLAAVFVVAGITIRKKKNDKARGKKELDISYLPGEK